MDDSHSVEIDSTVGAPGGEAAATVAASAPGAAAGTVASTPAFPFAGQIAIDKNPSDRRGRPRCPLFWALLALCIGIMVDRWAAVPFSVWLGTCAAALVLTLLSRKSNSANFALALAIAAAGGAWHHDRWSLFSEDDLAAAASYAPRPAAVRGIVASLPEVRPAPAFDPLQSAAAEERTEFELVATSMRLGEVWTPAAGRCSVLVEGRCDELLPGDELEIFGQLSRLQSAGNPGEFDFAADDRAKRMLTTIRAPHVAGVSVLSVGSTFNFQRITARMRRSCGETLRTYLPENLSGFAAALLIGERQNLGHSRRENFLLTNSMHFLAISGLHIGILAAAFFVLLRLGLVPRRWALAAVVGVTLFYLVLSGGQPPAVRSVVLVVVTCCALVLNRSSIGLNSLSLAGLIVLAINPADLFRVGPQLSFLAVLTLMVIAPWCGRLFAVRDTLTQLIHKHQSWPRRTLRWLAVNYLRGVVISCGVWLVTLPLVAARFHLVAPIASPLSPFLWPLIAMALFSGFGLLLFGPWLEPAANACAWVCEQMLSLIDELVTLGADLPASHFWVRGPDDWWLIGAYSLVGFALLICRSRRAIAGLTALMLLWLAAGAIDVLTSYERPRGQLRCTVLSMRHGCCVVVELPDQRVLVYDAGRLGSPRGATQSISAYLWHRGITSIDQLVISHDDADHFNAVPGLLDHQFEFLQALTPPQMLDGELSPATAALRDALVDHAIDVDVVAAGDVLLESSAADFPYVVRVLHPPSQEFAGSDNAQSVVLSIEYAGRVILLPGDLEPPGLEMLISNSQMDCDFLLAPHHGSRSSDPPGFAAWCQPEATVISGGRTFSVETVAQDYLRAGSAVYHTADCGAVTYRVNADGRATLWTYLSPPDGPNGAQSSTPGS